MYRPHPSRELNNLFEHRPWQGVDPMRTKFLFIGLDANYEEGLEQQRSFQDVLSYHRDGVSFWRNHGVHHPFLLPHYRGGGRRYHRSFARIGFGPEHAELVSFAELLHVPTVGRSALTVTDFDASHSRMLHAAIFQGHAKHVFLSSSVVKHMRKTCAFPLLSLEAVGSGPLTTLYRDGGRSVHLHLHFSVYGKFQRRLEQEASAIASLITEVT